MLREHIIKGETLFRAADRIRQAHELSTARIGSFDRELQINYGELSVLKLLYVDAGGFRQTLVLRIGSAAIAARVCGACAYGRRFELVARDSIPVAVRKLKAVLVGEAVGHVALQIGELG